MLEQFAHWVQGIVRDIGYPGLFLLIVLESTMVPIPSLLVMPFAGFLAERGEFSLPVILLLNSAGALVGSGLSYWFGAKGGKPLLERYGKYVFVGKEDLVKTEAFFAKHGAWTVFIGRFVPVVRHIISIPAGLARMPLKPFFMQTFLGATLWGGGLMVLGYVLGTQWEGVMKVAKKFDLGIALVIVAVIGGAATVFFLRRRRANRERAGGANGG